MANFIDHLQEHLLEGQNWEKVETDVPGVYVVKIPATKTRPAKLMVEVNPVDEATGKPKKRKGLFIADFEMYVQFLEAMQDERIEKLIKTVDGINPQQTATKAKKIKIE